MSDAGARLAAALHVAEEWLAGVVAEVAGYPWPAAAALALGGLLVLLAGSRFRRPLGAVGGAALGAASAALLGDPVATWLSVSPAALAGVVAAVAGAACVVLPPLFPVLAGALPGALLAPLLAPPGEWALALGIGAAVGGAMGLLLSRLLAAASAGAVGALATAVAAAALLKGIGPGRVLAAHPVAVLAVALVLAVAGTAFQLAREPTPARAARSRVSPASGTPEAGP